MKKIKLKHLDLEGVAVLSSSQMMEVFGGVSWTTTTTTAAPPITYRGCSTAIPCDGGSCQKDDGDIGTCGISVVTGDCVCG